MNKKISFIASNITDISDPSQKQFANLKIDAFASGDNLHGIYISDETLYKTAHTIINKPLLWAYNKETDDIGGHDPTEVPCGVIPESNQLTFTRMDDGRTMLSVVARVWKQYSGYLLDFFKRDGAMKPVSVEIEVLGTQKHVDDTLELTDFAYTGVTILGSQLIPAIPGAKALVLNFAEATDAYNKAYLEEFGAEQMLGVENKLKEGQVIVKIEQQFEDNTEVEQELNDEVQQESVGEVEETVVETAEAEHQTEAEEETSEVVEEEVEVEVAQFDILQSIKEAFQGDEVLLEKFDEGDYQGFIEYLATMWSEMKAKLTSLEEQKEELEFSHQDLVKFKEDAEKEALEKEISSTIEDIKSVVSKEEVDSLLDSAKEYNLENIKEWKNAAQAAAYRATQTAKPQENVEVVAPLPKNGKKGNSSGLLWD